MKRLLLTWVLLSVRFLVGASSLLDPSWTTGQLENGLRYFIRPNAEPQGRVELRLVVNAGSILEADDQQGLAHYLEHMAFNGTTHFEKDELVTFLESLGVAFGPDLNAYTSFDETVYQLRLPTEDPEVVKQAFLVLADWAGGILNTDEELEAERGVILEERRGRRGAEARIRDLQYPIIFNNSRYANRLPIGVLEVLEEFDFERIRDFYRDWYRPELMSIVAVGDLEVPEIQGLIDKHFSSLKNDPNAPERVAFTHPTADAPRTGVLTDPEVTDSDLALIWVHPPEPLQTVEAYVEAEKERLVTDMLNQRLSELSLRSDAPFLGAGTYAGGFTRASKVFYLFAAVKNEAGAHMQGGKAIMTELERAKRFGFTQGELDRAIARRLQQARTAAAEKDKTNSAALARELVQHALEGDLVLGPEKTLEVLESSLPDMTPDRALEMLRAWVATEDLAILAKAPEPENPEDLPTDADLLSLPASAKALDLEPYVDALSDASLTPAIPEPGTLVSEDTLESLGLIKWTYANGAKVIVKPTDFKADEIRVSAWKPGGWNQATDVEWPKVRNANDVASVTGVGAFSLTDLEKLLAGKNVRLTTSIQEDQVGLSGVTSPKDLETFLQLLYARCTSVREDEDAFVSLQNRLRASLENRKANPGEVFRDLIQVTMSNYHMRDLPMTVEDVDALDLQTSLDFFSRQFADAGQMTFFVVGNVQPDTLKPLVAQWIGSLPGTPSDEARTFEMRDYPRFEIQRTLRKGLEPVSEVHMVWTSEDFEWSYGSRHALQSMVGALRIRLREVVREEQGGTYHVATGPRYSHYPEPRKQLIIRFGCDPERVEELIAEVERLVKEVSTTPLDQRYIDIVRETQLRRRETDLRDNSFWEYVIPFYEWHEEDPEILLEFETYVESITPESIRKSAEEMFSTPHRAVLTLMPGESTNE